MKQSMYEYIKANTNLPKQDVRRIVLDARLKNWTYERALAEARALYIK